MPSLLDRLKAGVERISLGNRPSHVPSFDLTADMSSGEPVTINVYDMIGLNVYTNSIGIGVYHTGVVIYGTEYCYGGHPFNYSGIFAMLPKDCNTLGVNYSYRTTIAVGRTDFTQADISLILEDLGPRFRGDQYHLLHRNCNHFSDEFIQVLCGASLPKWINRLATVGAKIPFIERTIPRLWLTPRPLEELQLFSEQHAAPPESDHRRATGSRTSCLRRPKSASARDQERKRYFSQRSAPVSTSSPAHLGANSSGGGGFRSRTLDSDSEVELTTILGCDPLRPAPASTPPSGSPSDASTGHPDDSDSQRSRWSLLISSCLPMRSQHRVSAAPERRPSQSDSLFSSSKMSSASGRCFPNSAGLGQQDLPAPFVPFPCDQCDDAATRKHDPKEVPSAHCLMLNCSHSLATGLLVRFQSLCGVNGTGSDSPPSTSAGNSPPGGISSDQPEGQTCHSLN